MEHFKSGTWLEWYYNVHFHQLSKGSGPLTDATGLILEQKVGDAERFVIESIKGHKVNQHGDNVYLVSWRGYSQEYDSWEPATNFDDGSSITNYWRNKKRKILNPDGTRSGKNNRKKRKT